MDPGRLRHTNGVTGPEPSGASRPSYPSPRCLTGGVQGIQSVEYLDYLGKPAVERVREDGYIPFAVYFFGYMVSTCVIQLVLLGTVLSLLFALMAWPPFWSWVCNPPSRPPDARGNSSSWDWWLRRPAGRFRAWSGMPVGR